ncbi:RNA-directed DNA polymerase, eukaryota, reverse transcriptase zinc-binding domain protein [Tanacetum coccineum]
MTWVSWRKVMAHKQYGGLGVSSLFALNRALLFKWIWRFLTNEAGLWLNVVKVIHGDNGSLAHSPPSRSGCSVWIGVLKAIDSLKSRGVDLMEFCNKVIGNGNNSMFWQDTWLGQVCLKEKFHRLYNLELQKDVSVSNKLNDSNLTLTFRRRPMAGIEESQLLELTQLLSSVILSSANDRWNWNLDGHGVFSVKSAREEIDSHLLVTSSSSTRWSKVIPIKLNVFVWRMFLDKLPTRSNLSNRGLDIPCTLCPICANVVETRNHLFFGCSMYIDLMQLLCRWWNIQTPIISDPTSWETWFNNLKFNKLQKLALEASFFSMWWHIWIYRNTILFSSKKPLKSLIFDSIVSHTWLWVSSRCKKLNVNWVAWLKDPLNAISMFVAQPSFLLVFF